MIRSLALGSDGRCGLPAGWWALVIDEDRGEILHCSGPHASYQIAEDIAESPDTEEE